MFSKQCNRLAAADHAVGKLLASVKFFRTQACHIIAIFAVKAMRSLTPRAYKNTAWQETENARSRLARS